MSAGSSHVGRLDPAEIARIVARTSEGALAWFRQGTTAVDDKAGADGFDPVTEADRAVEAALRAQLAATGRGYAVIGEEGGTTGDPTTGRAWIIDPIDGTRAFISGQPQWGTLLGLLEDGRPIAGWMHLPVLGETFWAAGARGGVESPTTSRFGVSDVTALAAATVLSTHPGLFGGDPGPAKVFESARLTRFGGDCHNYGLLATGDVDAVIDGMLQPYDILPLVPIVEAAGGVVTDVNGDQPLGGGTVVAAATAHLHAEIMAILAG